MDKFASRLMLANVANWPFVLSGITCYLICGSSFSVTVANGSSSVHAVNVEPTASRTNSAIYIFFIMDDCLIDSFQYPTTEGCANYLFLPCARWLHCSFSYYMKIPFFLELFWEIFISFGNGRFLADCSFSFSMVFSQDFSSAAGSWH